MQAAAPIRFALVGNPNCGKTALFNRLTGARAKVANYAGVTVEKRSGALTGLPRDAELIDLPGTYSLFVTSPDEQVTRNVLLGQMRGELPPDVLVAVVDATNLRLGLRLVMELQQLGRPMILALNLADAAQQRGIRIDTAKLAQRLGIPVVETVAIRRDGVADLVEQLRRQAVSQIEHAPLNAKLERSDSVEALYARIEALLAECVTAPVDLPPWQDRLDSLVMHPVLGLCVLLTVLLLMFQAVFAWAKPIVSLIQEGTAAFGAWVGTHMPAGVLHNLLVDGVIAGAGGVLVFLPQIVILFFFILALEDSGYLPRGAFLLDRLMRGVGLSGRSFIPLLSSFACAVPGIMATRTVQDPKERLITIMIAPLMTCSARLPVYAVIIAAFIPQQTIYGFFNLQGLVLFALYAAGIVSAAIIACGKSQSTSSVKSNEAILYKKSLQGSDEASLQGRLFDALRRYATTTEGTRTTSLKVVRDDFANIEKVFVVAEGESITCQNTMYTMAPYSCDFALKGEELSWEKDKNSVQAVLFNAIASATNQRGAEYVGLNDSLGNSIVCYKQSYGYSCTLQLPSAVENPSITVDPNTTGENPSTGIPAFF